MLQVERDEKVAAADRLLVTKKAFSVAQMQKGTENIQRKANADRLEI